MNYEKNLFLSINQNLNKYIFYSNSNSNFNSILSQFNNLGQNFSSVSFINFINSDKANLLVEEENLTKIKRFMNLPHSDRDEFAYNDLLDDLKINENFLPSNPTIIEPIRDNLPFKSFDSIAIDKSFIKDFDSSTYKEIRKQLNPVENLIYSLQQKKIFIPGINIIFHHSNEEDQLGYNGYFNRDKLFVSSEKLICSSFHHEYFHAMDCELANILNLNSKDAVITFSDINNYQGNELKEFRNFLSSCDQNNSTPQQTKDNLNLYFKKHFSIQFNHLNLEDISDNFLYNELENFRGGIYTNGKGNNKFSERDEVINELREHISYSLGKGDKPAKTIFSSFLKAADLNQSYDYYIKNSEKLARIYQSQFETVENSRYKKIFPEGSEYNKLVPSLNKIIEKEFKPMIQKKTALNNISQLKNKLSKAEPQINSSHTI